MLIQQQKTNLLVFLSNVFNFLVTTSINKTESSSDFIILIVSFITSFKINKVNHFLAFRAPVRLIL